MSKEEINKAKKLLKLNGYSISKNKLNTSKSIPKNNPKKGTLGCKDNCCDYPDCASSCRIRWYHK